jgi:cell wall-associated NlpC family hydrolase
MKMTTRCGWLAVWLFASAIVTGCASTGGVPRPQPFPGANTPKPSEKDIAAPVTETAANADLIATAMALRGTAYRNGGSEPSRGFDCSGFVQWVFAQHGTALPRETREQYREGRKLDRDDVQPGDLVFFETVSRGPSHVGIALGAGQFVHAPSSRGVVRVERYTSGYWASKWVGARRISRSG